MTKHVTVIIPTLGTVERRNMLLRCLASLQRQRAHSEILIVANGLQRSENLLKEAAIEFGAQTLLLDEANLVAAIATGVERVGTEYFCFLDDDDTYEPDTITRRINYMRKHPHLDAIATPGQQRLLDGTTTYTPKYLDSGDLIGSLFHQNWLASCGGFFKTSRVGPNFFWNMPRYLEWTYLALRLAQERRIEFVDDKAPHFTVFETPGSESAQLSYLFAMPENIKRLRDLSSRPELADKLSLKLAQALHTGASRSLKQGMIKQAWKFHLAGMSERGGWRHVLFTRKLVYASVKSHFR